MRRFRLLIFLSLIVLMGLGSWKFYNRFLVVKATQETITSRLDFENGSYQGTESWSKEGDLKLLSAGTWNPRVLKTPKLTLTNQSAVVSDGKDIYLLVGNDKYFAKYLSDEDRWITLEEAPHMAYNGTDMVLLGNYIYAVFGSYTKVFSRYSIINNEWEDLTDAPDLMSDGASLETDGDHIFILRGTSTSDFWQYDPHNGHWTSLNNPPVTMGAGADLVYKDGYIYTPRGASTNSFYKYTVSSGLWSTLPNIPGTISTNHNSSVLGGYIYVNRDANTNTFYRFNINGNAWETLTNLPQTAQYVGVVGVGDTTNGFVYVFRGNGSYDFWKYNPRTANFEGPTELPNTPSTGADLIYGNGNVYFRRGASSTSFYKYNLSIGGTWATLSSSPAAFADDTKGVKAGNYYYYLRGSNTNTFYRYDPNTGVGGTWTTMANTTATMSYGASLVYPGSGNYIYATRGGLNRTFMRYTIGVGETWSDVAVADLPDDAEAGYGSRMISDGIDIYYIAGTGISRIYKYSISGNSWTDLGVLPFSPYYGTDMTYYNGKIYFLAGNLKADFWEYTITSGSWRLLPMTQTYGSTEIGSWSGGSITNDENGNFYVELGNSNTRFFSFNLGVNNYLTSGSWTSNTRDLGYVSHWNPLNIESSTPSGTNINWQTRTSDDTETWEEWKSGVGSSIASTPNRYIQIKVNLNSDGTATPVLNKITIDYDGDTTPPTNPNLVVAKSQQVAGIDLTSGQDYTYISPYFTWSGDSDNETAVAGYYVYFGIGETTDPQISGSFKTDPNYLVNDPMDQETYYLRIRTVNGGGLVSEPMTLFVYKYKGLSPPSSLLQTTSADFDQGTTSNVVITNDQIKLSGKNGFWQQDRLSPLSGTINYGSGLAYSASRNKLYILRGSGTNSFYTYDLATNIGSTLANAPATVYYGSDLVEGPDGYLYALRGYTSNGFWRYDPTNNVWSDEAAADTPQPVSYGGSLTYDGERYIYALKGNSDDTFMRYDTMADNWEVLDNTDFGAVENQINNIVANGGDLAFGEDNQVYVIQGGARTGFSVYNTNSGNWRTLDNLPVLSNYGSQIEYDVDNKAIYYISGWGKTFFYKYDLESSRWIKLADVPYGVGAGATMKKVGNSIYLAIGGSSANMYRYDIDDNSWAVPNMGLFGGFFRGSDSRYFTYGAEITKGDGDNYYLVRGNYDNLFVRYNPKTGVTTKMADAPAGFYQGGDLVYDNVNNKIYAIASPYFRKMFVYNVATDVWSEETSDPPPVDVGAGASMTFDGVRYIYLTRGGNTNNFYRFDVNGSSGSKWITQTNVAATLNSGSEIVYKNNYIYALRGNNTNTFLRYDIGTTTWSDAAVADLPSGANVTGDGILMDLGGDKLMACRGNNTTICYEYSVGGNNWTASASTLAPYIYRGAAGASDGNNTALIIPGNGTVNTPTDGIYSYISQSDDSSFEENGSYISPVHDLGVVYRFASLDVGVSMALNTSLEVYTKTSEDNLDWGDWILASDKREIDNNWIYKINSSPARYLKVKLELTSGDGVRTGEINSYQINYYKDEGLPTNPINLVGYLGVGNTTTITSGVWSNSTAPYFQWSGATDGSNGSGIDGYYTYFGLGETADPQVLGTYTTATSVIGTGLTSGQTYYLRMQTKDNAGNLASDVGTTFVYKFDNTNPTNPTTISADPPGYTASNNFTFTWNEGIDIGSGVYGYCYKIGIGGSETCVEGAGTTTVTGIEAYQTGTNTFYLRTKDKAGNYSGDYITASFYYSSVAPGAPTNLSVGLSSNTINSFSFSWQPPTTYYGQQSGLRYYYSINETPSASNVNTVGLSVTYLSAGAYATRKDKNTLYVVVKDEAGNIDYNNYSSVDFYAQTSAPGIPENIDISDVSVKETKNWRLALAWEPPVASGSGVSTYKVYRSETENAVCSSNMDDFSLISTTTSESFVDTNLKQSTYYYCVKACDSTNECSAVSSTTFLLPDGKWRVAPTLLNEPEVLVKTKSATVNWTTSRTASSFVKYGKSSGDYGEEVGTSEQVSAHEINLSGLDPGTTYYYKVLWTDEDGNIGESSESTFSTNPAPIVSTVKITDASLYSAYVTFVIKNSTKVSIQYGKTTNYGETMDLSTSLNGAENTVKLENLEQGTEYHLRIQAFDEEGNIFTSDDYVFETLPLPKLSNLKVQQVKGMATATVRLLWQSNTDISSIVTYYPVGKSEMAKDQIKLTLIKNHVIVLTDLLDDTEYYLAIRGKDTMNNSAEPTIQKFKTSADLRPPTITNLTVESVVDGVGDEARAQAVVSWDTDEPATSQIEYGQGTGSDYPNKTQKDNNFTLNHSVTITDLLPSQVYHLRVLSEDKVGNLTKSYDNVLITSKATKSALNLVIENLSKSFGFISNLSGVNK